MVDVKLRKSRAHNLPSLSLSLSLSLTCTLAHHVFYNNKHIDTHEEVTHHVLNTTQNGRIHQREKEGRRKSMCFHVQSGNNNRKCIHGDDDDGSQGSSSDDHQKLMTQRRHSPLCSRSNASLIRSKLIVCVM